jgi:ribonuclease HII
MPRVKPTGPPDFREERAWHARGALRVAGVDEAGRGAWAGPVFAAAVILPDTPALFRGIDDSKKLKAVQREAMRIRIERDACCWALGSASAREIDQLGILPATRLAMLRAVAGLSVSADALLIDAVKLPEAGLPFRAFNFADAISLSVAAASILAKTARDRVMQQLDSHTPGYRFGVHKGYGTRAHATALAANGPCAHHRHSFKPIAQRTYVSV